MEVEARPYELMEAYELMEEGEVEFGDDASFGAFLQDGNDVLEKGVLFPLLLHFFLIL